MVCITLVKLDVPKGGVMSGRPPAQGDTRKPGQETSLTQRLQASRDLAPLLLAGPPRQGTGPRGRDRGQAVLERNPLCQVAAGKASVPG